MGKRQVESLVQRAAADVDDFYEQRSGLGGDPEDVLVISVDGNFERGDAVIVRSSDGRELARGLSGYSSADAQTIAGHKSNEIEAILGYRGGDEIIHRDDLVLTGQST